jgi:cytochrome d ubiquinol oxidase subunit II
VVGVVTGIVVFAALIPVTRDAPTLSEGLTGRAAPLLVASGLAGVATLVLLVRRRYSLGRVTAAVAVGTVVAGWGVGQYPWLLVDEVRIVDAAGASATLSALMVAVALAAVLVLPALAYLYWLTQSERWAAHD